MDPTEIRNANTMIPHSQDATGQTQQLHGDGPAGFRSVPRTGVIYVMTEAAARGYRSGDSGWANLGQGAPECGPLPGGSARIEHIELKTEHLEYAPVDGLQELKQSVADLYNQRYRQNKTSKYTSENVAISAGGRAGLTRLVSTIGRTNVGHFIPDYTAYEELLDTFGTFVPIPILLSDKAGYAFSEQQLSDEILGRGLSALILSNPCNPTGKVIHGTELDAWVRTSRELGCTLILDEFYSHYVYVENLPSVSAAAFVEDVNSDPIVILDGLTKNWRYPGLRVAWTVGPRDVIAAAASAGSFLDGGSACPMQVAALPLVKLDIANREAASIQRSFIEKRDYMIAELAKLDIPVVPSPLGGFYCWGSLDHLPESLGTGMQLFQKALDEQLIIVPGEFFDINPGHRRPNRPSRFHRYARFSFGPKLEELERGIVKLRRALGRN